MIADPLRQPDTELPSAVLVAGEYSTTNSFVLDITTVFLILLLEGMAKVSIIKLIVKVSRLYYSSKEGQRIPIITLLEYIRYRLTGPDDIGGGLESFIETGIYISCYTATWLLEEISNPVRH